MCRTRSARRKWPCRCRATEQRDVLAPPHVPPPTSGEGFLLAKTIALWKEARAGFHRIWVRADFSRGACLVAQLRSARPAVLRVLLTLATRRAGWQPPALVQQCLHPAEAAGRAFKRGAGG